jgi:hypothetical protein
MDIEFTRWGDSSEHTNAQYVIQPCSQCPGCGSNCTRFRIDLTEAAQDLTHYMVWKPDSVEFRTYYGKHVENPPQNDLVYKWSAAGDHVPDTGTENVRSNFWLLRGLSPVSGQGDEAVITHFSWQEETPWPDPVIQVTTNLSNYPIFGCFPDVDKVEINGSPVSLDAHGGFRQDVIWNSGLNEFAIVAYKKGEIWGITHIRPN